MGKTMPTLPDRGRKKAPSQYDYGTTFYKVMNILMTIAVVSVVVCCGCLIVKYGRL